MTLELDVISYLSSDTQLTTLLGANGDTKLFPIQSPIGSTAPFIVYNTPDDGTFVDNILEKTMFFDCIDSEWIDSNNIKERVSILLNLEDKIRNSIPSSKYKLYWCKLVGGTSFIDTDTKLVHDVVLFNLKYARLDFEFLLTEDGEYILTEDGQRIIIEL